MGHYLDWYHLIRLKSRGMFMPCTPWRLSEKRDADGPCPGFTSRLITCLARSAHKRLMSGSYGNGPKYPPRHDWTPFIGALNGPIAEFWL